MDTKPAGQLLQKLRWFPDMVGTGGRGGTPVKQGVVVVVGTGG